MGTDTVDSGQDEGLRKKSISLSEINDDRKPLPKKLKYLTAATIFYGATTLGCGFNTYGPVATSMQNKYETDDEAISKVFTIITGCYMVGALTGGLIYDYFNRQLAMIIIVTTQAAMMFLTPHCPTLTTFFISAGIMGFVCGGHDAAHVVWTMEMLQKDCPPFVQAQHFCYAIGTMLPSLIFAPFLDEEEDDETTTVSSFSLETSKAAKTSEETNDSKLFIPYTIVGILVGLHAVAQILLFMFLRYYPPPPEEVEVIETFVSNEKTENGQLDFKIGSWSLLKFRIVLLSAAFYGALQSTEMTTINFFPKFGQNSDLNLSESESAYVLTGLTGAYAVGRGIAIVAVFKIHPQILLCGNIVLVIIANILLVGWAQTSLPIFWASSILFGFGYSSMYASFSAYIERYMNFTNFIGGLMVVCGSGVAAIYPLIIGKSIENNPVVLSYTIFFSIALFTSAFAIQSYLTHKDKTRY